MNEIEPCSICGGAFTHRVDCPWWKPDDEKNVDDDECDSDSLLNDTRIRQRSRSAGDPLARRLKTATESLRPF